MTSDDVQVKDRRVPDTGKSGYIHTSERHARALAKGPFLHEIEEPDEDTRKEIELMHIMGLPTYFLNSPRDLESDEEVFITKIKLFIIGKNKQHVLLLLGTAFNKLY